MTEETTRRREATAAPREVTPKLNLRRLDALQRWLQYGATVALLVVVVFIVVSLLGLRRLNREIASKQSQSANLQADIESLTKKRDELITEKEALSKENEKLKPFVVAYDKAGTDDPRATGAQLTPPAAVQLPARIYLHVAGDNQNSGAKGVANQLRLKGYVVPDIENVGAGRSPNLSQVRYYEAADPGATAQADKEADDIVAAVRASTGIEMEKKRFPYSRNVRPRHYEIWFGKNFPPAP